MKILFPQGRRSWTAGALAGPGSRTSAFSRLTHCAALLLLSATGVLAGSTAAERVELLLKAMGGREAWTRAKFIYVEAKYEDLAVAAPYTNQTWNDLSQPRVRFEARNETMDRRHAINGESGWRWRDGVSGPLTPDQFTGEIRWWESNMYRTLHRLAAEDPELTVRAVGEHRIDIYRIDGTRLNWFVLNSRGEPVLFGTWDSDAGNVVGPLVTSGPVRHPRWGARQDGTWRYDIVQFTVSESVPASVNFASP